MIFELAYPLGIHTSDYSLILHYCLALFYASTHYKMLLDLAQRIIQSIECSKSWKAQIMVQGTTFYNSSTLNLVDYLHTSLARDDSFPKDTCLRFDNFEGLDSKEHIVKYIKEKAREDGTVLCYMVLACKDTS